MRRKKIILIDMDDTLTHHLEHWLEWLNHKYNKEVKKHEVIEWDMCKAYPDLTEEQVLEPLDDPTFYKHLKGQKDAIYYLEMLMKFRADAYKVYIVTNSRYKALNAKIEGFLKEFPFFSWENIIVCKDKYLIKGDVLIDDNPDNLKNFKGVRILKAMPHNENSKVKKAIRLDGWYDICNYLYTHI